MVSAIRVKWDKESSINKAFDELFNVRSFPSQKMYPMHYLGVDWIFSSEQWENFCSLISDFIVFYELKKTHKFQTIQQLFNNIVSKWLECNKIEYSVFSDLIRDTLNSRQQEHIFIFVVENLFTDKSYTFGNITLCNGSQVCDEIGKTIPNHVLGLLNSFESTKNGGDVVELNDYLTQLQSKTIIQVKEVGDKEFSKERALINARKFLNKILFFSSISFHFEVLPCLEIDGKREAQYLKIHACNQKISFGHLDSMPIIKFCFRSTDILSENLDKFHFNELVLNSSDDISNRISTAIDWYASAIRSNEQHLKFLYYCIGLESLFSFNNNGPVSETLADNCAFLLEENIKNRMKLKREVKNLYTHRSGLAHGRNAELIDDDLNKARNILCYSIIDFIKLRYQNEILKNNDLIDYFERCKFDSSKY
ncbi:HEPN domain-containing protein [Acinetobacter baumannii]|nr:HEPN domain-containing protein [Acinetobacter baumannii]